MRRKQYAGAITLDKATKIEPFRSIKLTADEVAQVQALIDDKGKIPASAESEALLLKLLTVRGMESLLYPKPPAPDWSGYCKLDVENSELWLL